MSDDFREVCLCIGRGLMLGLILFVFVLLATGLLSGCASECAYKSNGYCYHVGR